MYRLSAIRGVSIGVVSGRYTLNYYIQALLGVFLVLLYQWSLFEAASLLLLTAILKGVIPCVIIIFSSPKYTFGLYLKGTIFIYLLIMAIFVSWMLLTSVLFSTTLEFSLLQSIKITSRILAFMAFVTIVSQQRSLLLVLKLLVYVGLFSVVQYLLIALLWGHVEIFEIPGTRGSYHGPIGILGSMYSWMYLPEGGVFLRATGYWYEPTHLSIYMFSMFFVSRYLFKESALRRWKLYSILFLIVGVCSLSMAGFLAFGVGVMFYAALSRFRYWVVYFFLGFAIAIGGLTSRLIPKNYLPATVEILIKNKGHENLNKASGGRLERIMQAISVFVKNPFGIGTKIPGFKTGQNSENYIKYATGNDYILWLVMGGIPAIILLLLRDLLLFKFIRNDRLSIMAFVVCIGNIFHAMIYDSLFSMMLLLFSAIVLFRRDQLGVVCKKEKVVEV